MHYVEEQIFATLQDQIILWVRYIDDIFLICKSHPSLLLPYVNRVNQYIQFTLEMPANNILPFLDVELTRTNNMFQTHLYTKKIHSGHIMPWKSHVSTNIKVGIVKTERTRATTASNTFRGMQQSINMLYDKFLHNGYPRQLLNRILLGSESHNNINNNTVNNNSNNTTKPVLHLKLPFVTNQCNREISRILHATLPDFSVSLISKHEAPLSIQVNRRPTKPCDHRCICQSRHICHTKNIVYLITCNLCGQKYIGESQRMVITRLLEHCQQSQSEVFKHFQQNHNTMPAININFEWRILKANFHSTAHRKVYEKEQILIKKPAINIHFRQRH